METKELELTKELEEQAKLIEQKREFINSLLPRINALNQVKDALVADIERSNLDKDEKKSLYQKIGNYVDGKAKEINSFSIIRSREVMATDDDAQQIFGRNLLKVELIESVYGKKTDTEVPIGFTLNFLETVQKNVPGKFKLVPEVSKIGDTDLTLLGMSKLATGKTTQNGTPLFWNGQLKDGKYAKDCWYKDDKIITLDQLGDSYRLSHIDFISETTSKTVAQQMKLTCLCTLVEFKDVLPERWKNAIDIFLKDADMLIALEQSDWQEASRKLGTYEVFEILWEGPTSTLHAEILYEKEFGVRKLTGLWKRNKIVSSGLDFLRSGNFGEDGMYVDGRTPGYTSSGIGASVSCTGKVKK